MSILLAPLRRRGGASGYGGAGEAPGDIYRHCDVRRVQQLGSKGQYSHGMSCLALHAGVTCREECKASAEVVIFELFEVLLAIALMFALAVVYFWFAVALPAEMAEIRQRSKWKWVAVSVCFSPLLVLPVLYFLGAAETPAPETELC